MILTDLIKEQALQSAIMFSAGLGFGMLYQIWSILRKAAVRRAAAAQEARIAARKERAAAKEARRAQKAQRRAQKTQRADRQKRTTGQKKRKTQAISHKTNQQSSEYAMEKYTKKRRRSPKRVKTEGAAKTRISVLSAVLEFIFWPFAAFFVSEFMYYAAYGDISFHNFLALGLGVLLWRKVFYDIVY